jgi:MFS family permease
MTRAEQVRAEPGAVGHARLWPYYLVVGLVISGFGAIFTLLGELRDQFGFSDIGVGLIASVGLFASLVAQLALARYADRGHSVRMIRLGLVLSVVSMAAMSVVDTLVLFVAARATLGIAAGLVMPAARRIVIASDPRDVGVNLGRLASADIAGFAVGPALSAVLFELGGLRAPFVALGLVMAVCVPLVTRGAVDPGRVDVTHRPVRELLRSRAILAVMLVATGFYLMIGTFDAVWAVLLTDHGAATWVIGVTITIFALPMVVVAPFGGGLAQRRGAVRVATIGLVLAVPCVVAYGVLGSVLALSLVACLQSLFDAVTFPATQVGVAVASPPEQLAAAQGLLGAVELTSAGTMALIAGALYDVSGAGATFGVTAGAMVVCIAGSMLLSGGRAPGAAVAGPSTDALAAD